MARTIKMSGLRPADRLKMTHHGIIQRLHGWSAKGRYGTFIRYGRRGTLVVRRDGTKTPDSYAPIFWRRYTEDK